MLLPSVSVLPTNVLLNRPFASVVNVLLDVVEGMALDALELDATF